LRRFYVQENDKGESYFGFLILPVTTCRRLTSFCSTGA
jgi:hypothetical protein